MPGRDTKKLCIKWKYSLTEGQLIYRARITMSRAELRFEYTLTRFSVTLEYCYSIQTIHYLNEYSVTATFTQASCKV